MKNLRTFYTLLLLVASLCLPMSAVGHHGANNNPQMYHADNMIHLEGKISRVFWRNPHPRLMIMVTDEDGNEQEWELEMGKTVNGFTQVGIGADFFTVGDSVKAAGVVSKRDPLSIGLQNLLLPDGQEMINRNADPIWSQDVLVESRSRPSAEQVAAAEESANGLFRVWGRRNGPRPNPDSYSDVLTDEAKAMQANYDFALDNPELNCESGLASNMFDPTPMQITNNGDHIVIHTEEYDLKRIIYMTEDHPEPVASNLGFSTGKWHGDSLVVETSLIDWPNFDPYGTPQSLEMTYTETFSVAADDSRLNYKIVAHDPVYSTGSIELERSWLWQPGTQIVPFNCAAEVK